MFSEKLMQRLNDFRLQYPYKKWPEHFIQPEYQPINEALDLLLDILLELEFQKTDKQNRRLEIASILKWAACWDKQR